MPPTLRWENTALLKELRRRDCARRHWGSYRGRVWYRQRFPPSLKGAGIEPKMAHKTLMRLNFSGLPGMGLTVAQARQI